MSVNHRGDSFVSQAAFGEAIVTENLPQIEVLHHYGFDPTVMKKWIGPSGGTITDSTSYPAMVEVTSGTSAGTMNVYRSQSAIAYRPGRGAMLRMTARFSAAVAGNRQVCGGTSFLNGYGFGYDTNQRFGVFWKYGGQFDIWALTVTGGSGGATNATITVNGVAYTVPLTAGSAAFNAAEIAASLQSQLASLGFLAIHTGAVVYVARVYNLTPLSGSMLFSHATATASWSNIVVGSPVTYNWVYQDQWNGQSVPWLDPTKGNIYEFDMQYLGFGNVRMKVVDPGSGEFVTVHTFRHTNTLTYPHLRNPNLFATWESDNVTNTSAVTIYAGCAFGAVQGKRAQPNIQVHSFTKASVGTSETFLCAFRNDLLYQNDNVNQTKMRLVRINAITDSTKGARVTVYKGGTLTTPLWVNHSTANVSPSHVSLDTSATAFTTTTAVDVAELLCPPNGGAEWVTDGDNSANTIPVYPGEILIFTGRVVSGAASAIDFTVTWDESR